MAWRRLVLGYAPFKSPRKPNVWSWRISAFFWTISSDVPAYENIVFCWVMHQQAIIDDILSCLDISTCGIHTISLTFWLSGFAHFDAVKEGATWTAAVREMINVNPTFDFLNGNQEFQNILMALEQLPEKCFYKSRSNCCYRWFACSFTHLQNAPFHCCIKMASFANRILH